jgi:hypothetical protein
MFNKMYFQIALVLFSVPGYCQVLELKTLILNSDYIVVGNVEYTRGEMAVFRIEKTLKGNFNQNKIEYRLHSRFADDISRSVQGEKVLLFLSRERTEKYAKNTKNIRLDLYISEFGRGRMPFRIFNKLEYVTIVTRDIVFPASISSIPAQNSHSDSSICSVKYLDIENYITNTLNSLIQNKKP